MPLVPHRVSLKPQKSPVPRLQQSAVGRGLQLFGHEVRRLGASAMLDCRNRARRSGKTTSATEQCAQADLKHERQGVAAPESLLLSWFLKETGCGKNALHRLCHSLLGHAIAQAGACALKGCYSYGALRLEEISGPKETLSKLNQLGDGSSRHKSD